MRRKGHESRGLWTEDRTEWRVTKRKRDGGGVRREREKQWEGKDMKGTGENMVMKKDERLERGR